MTTMHEETYKGYTIQVVADEHYEADHLYENDAVFALTTNSGYFHLYGPDYKDLADAAAGDINVVTEYEAFDLHAYVHSGVQFSLTEFSCQWDSGPCGYVYVKRGLDFGGTNEEIAEGFVRTLNAVFSGDVYGFIVLDPEGEEVESCFGFVNDSDEVDVWGDALTAARAVVDYRTKLDRESREAAAAKLAAAIADVGEEVWEDTLSELVIDEKLEDACRINNSGESLDYLVNNGWTLESIKEHCA
ncbi:MAG: hypothetical protein P1V36_01635 [Planctomycetota bacterium]|nr:hypothetical protein [Planctomycetota bacterium]